MIKITSFTIIFLLLFQLSGYSFYCGSEPIGRWDTKEKVSRSCGKPLYKGFKKVFYKDSYVSAETWYYNCGSNDFIYEVCFYNNIVIKEGPLKRGYGKSQCE